MNELYVEGTGFSCDSQDNQQLKLWIGSDDPVEGICFVCGKILNNGQTFYELDKFGKWAGNMCSKTCIDKYWKWWHQEYHRLHDEEN